MSEKEYNIENMKKKTKDIYTYQSMVSSANASCDQIQANNANTLTLGTSSVSENRSITITLLNKSYKKKELMC